MIYTHPQKELGVSATQGLLFFIVGYVVFINTFLFIAVSMT